MRSPYHTTTVADFYTRLAPLRRLAAALLAAIAFVCGPNTSARADELPVLHLRKAASPPPMVAAIDDPSQGEGWYSASPTWFGNGGQDGARTHVEVLATYDDNALYLAFLVIDKSPVFARWVSDYPLSDRNIVYIQTPQGRTFGFMPQLNAYYPAGGIATSGETTGTGIFDVTQNALPGWWNVGWTSGFTWRNMVTIPWSAMGTGAPAPGSRWRINFVNANQTSAARTAATINVQQWAPGSPTQPDQWGYLAFDEAKFTPPAVSPEATLTLRPATGYGSEVTVCPGDFDTLNNVYGNGDAAFIQSNWNDMDPIQYDLKELMQFDLSMIPRDRVILSATLDNHFRAPFEGNPTDQYVHVERLAGPYDRNSVTMLTSPLPVENGDREFVPASAAGSWVHFDVTDAVSKAFAGGASQVSLALAGSACDLSNGKAWDWSFGRADWYDAARPQLHITFGKPGVAYAAPLPVGSLNATSLAGPNDKNKLTNGTFRYGATEGISNTTYWQDPGSAFTDHNIPLMQLDGDVNPTTGDPAMRLLSVAAWRHVQQTVMGLTPGQVYTMSGWIESAGIQVGMGVNYYDASGNIIGQGYGQYNGGGDWEHVQATSVIPAGTASAQAWVEDQSSTPTGYALISDLQLEAGATPTAYSETMGVYYPDHPRADGTSTAAVPLYRLYNPLNNDHFYTTNSAEAQAAQGSGYVLEGVIGDAPAPATPGTVPVYRLYSPYNAEHFYTVNPAESAAVQAFGYTLEGIGFYTLASPGANTEPLWRLYWPAGGRHFYTTSPAEYALVLAAGFSAEGTLGYLYPAP